jgi:hypothetical protein
LFAKNAFPVGVSMYSIVVCKKPFCFGAKKNYFVVEKKQTALVILTEQSFLVKETVSRDFRPLAFS